MHRKNEFRNSFQRIAAYSAGHILSLSIGLGPLATAHTPQSLPISQDNTGADSAAQHGQGMQILEPGRPVQRELSGGQSHSYQLTLKIHQYVRVSVEQRGIDVVVSLHTFDRKTVAESQSDNGNFGPEQVSFIAEESGTVQIEVRAHDQSASGGQYEVKIAELRMATEQDRKRVAAERAFAEGGRLRRQGTAESLGHAAAKYEAALSLYRDSGDRNGEATALDQIGEIYYLTSEMQKALESFNSALLIYQSLGERGAEAIALNSVGRIYLELGDRKKAWDYFDHALPIARSANHRLAESMTLCGLGNMYYIRGETQKALDYYDQALRLRRIIGPRRKEASIYSDIALVYHSIGEKPKALDYYNQALAIDRAVGDRRSEACVLSGIGVTFSSMGEKQKALDYYHQALPLSRETGDKASEATTLNNIGGAYNALGERQKSLQYYQQSLALHHALGARPEEGITLNNLGLLYNSLGEKRRALQYLDQALRIKQEVGDRRGTAVTLNNIGNIYSDLNENQKALEFLNKALLIREEVNDKGGKASTLHNIGNIYGRLDDKLKALEYFEQALTFREAVGDLIGQASTLHNIGVIFERLGNSEKALETYARALELRQLISDQQGEADTLLAMARVERDCGNLMEASAKMEASLNLIESLRAKINVGDLRASYFGTAQKQYEFGIDLLMRLHRLDPSKGYAAGAFQISERARARTLIELLAESRELIRQGVDSVLLERERTVERQLDAKADRLTRLLGSKKNEEQASTVRSEIEALRAEYQQVKAQIRTASPRYAALTQPQPLCLTDIQKQVLDPDTILLEYALGKECSYLWAVTTDTIASFELPGHKAIKGLAERVHELLTARNRSKDFETADEKQIRISRSDTELSKAVDELSHMLLDPVAGQLNKKRLLIVSQGALQYVPFAALPEPGVGSSVYKNRQSVTDNRPPLVIGHEIVTLPSASTLAVLRQELAERKPAPKTVAVLADPVFDLDDVRLKGKIADIPKAPAEARGNETTEESELTRAIRDLGLREGFHLSRIPYTRKEAQAILALTPANERKGALDFAASQSTATSPELGQYRYLHFATHGLMDPIQPDLSGIVLSLVNEEGKEQDGFLRAHQIFNLHLPAEMVVLSGCQTGLGKELRGEGLIGLTRGFMYAGAARVLVSLWEVNDQATAELMARLYRKMLGKERLTPAAALRAAQVEMWKTSRWQSPYYWAAFTLQGEPR